jgi:hypothetical protein
MFTYFYDAGKASCHISIMDQEDVNDDLYVRDYAAFYREWILLFNFSRLLFVKHTNNTQVHSHEQHIPGRGLCTPYTFILRPYTTVFWRIT